VRPAGDVLYKGIFSKAVERVTKDIFLQNFQLGGSPTLYGYRAMNGRTGHDVRERSLKGAALKEKEHCVHSLKFKAGFGRAKRLRSKVP
jgi:hypothetical protein